jgi:NADH:ubiquinone oxidoreductase subunit K
MMSTAMKGRLIGLAVIELVLFSMYLFGTANPAVFAVLTIGVPVALLLVGLPISLYLRSKRSSNPN